MVVARALRLILDVDFPRTRCRQELLSPIDSSKMTSMVPLLVHGGQATVSQACVYTYTNSFRAAAGLAKYIRSVHTYTGPTLSSPHN
jgi:hypothetical protein